MFTRRKACNRTNYFHRQPRSMQGPAVLFYQSPNFKLRTSWECFIHSSTLEAASHRCPSVIPIQSLATSVASWILAASSPFAILANAATPSTLIWSFFVCYFQFTGIKKKHIIRPIDYYGLTTPVVSPMQAWRHFPFIVLGGLMAKTSSTSPFDAPSFAAHSLTIFLNISISSFSTLFCYDPKLFKKVVNI